MPLPLIVALGVVAASGFVGTAGTVSAAKKNIKARNVQKSAEEILKKAGDDMEYYRQSTQKYFEELGKVKLSIAANELQDFVGSYSKLKGVDLVESNCFDELNRMNLSGNDISEMKNISTKASEVIGSGLAGVGTGALIGWGVYGGVSTLATSGTGVAIGALNGAAAANATLAWLGGGTLAAGGLGVAGGVAILGGIIAAPALALIGGLASVAAGRKLDKAYTNKAEAEKISEQVYTCGVMLHHFCEVAVLIRKNLERLKIRFGKANLKLAEIVTEKTDWPELTDSEKHSVAIAVKYAMAVKNFIDMPIITEDGLLTNEAESFYKEYAQSAVSIYKGEAQNKISKQDILKWKEENVDSPNEQMCIIDPLINMNALSSIILPDGSPENYLVFAAADKQSGEISCYAIVDRNAIDLNDINDISSKNRR